MIATEQKEAVKFAVYDGRLGTEWKLNLEGNDLSFWLMLG
jgi:hypothetical protein